MQIPFTKMQGTGNDFVVIDLIENPIQLLQQQIQHIADRHLGVGCDQVLTLSYGNQDNFLLYQIYNADGNEVTQCGNGARCIGSYLEKKKGMRLAQLQIETKHGELVFRADENGNPKVGMGIPKFEPKDIPALFPNREVSYSLSLNTLEQQVGLVSVGNPHAVIEVNDIDTVPVAYIGKSIQQLACFPESINVGFMQVLQPDLIQIRVYERGVGETLACGSGACAATIIGQLWNKLDNPVRIKTRGGELKVSWEGKNTLVWLSGPTKITFEGLIEL